LDLPLGKRRGREGGREGGFSNTRLPGKGEAPYYVLLRGRIKALKRMQGGKRTGTEKGKRHLSGSGAKIGGKEAQYLGNVSREGST